MNKSATAHFAESIPTGMDDLLGTEGVELTADALIRLTKAAKKTIDLTAMYWALKPDPDSKDEAGWPMETLKQELGADRGIALFEALKNAAGRGVKIRIIQSPGFDKNIKDESKELRDAHPGQISVQNVDMNAWYGSGIMHQKIWIFDGNSVYIGSANMDWKSLTQVKEIGIVVEHSEEFAAEVSRYYNAWWRFVGLDPEKNITKDVFDPVYRINRTVPSWSTLVPEADRKENPLNTPELLGKVSWHAPMELALSGHQGGVALSGAPKELCVGERTFDERMLVHAILDASETVCISVMDFAPVSLYRGKWDPHSHKNMVGKNVATPTWWPALVDALLHAVNTTGVHARLLISEWAHTNPFVTPYLQALDQMAQAALANHSMTAGKLEIRRFRVPGWRETGPIIADHPKPAFPGHTRVNHTKYIVTDRRINIGTSNMTWDYFSGTAGASFDATHPFLVKKLAAIFDRDWTSDYARPLADGSPSA